MNAGQYSTHNVITVRQDFSIPDAARLMREHHVGSLIVVAGDGDEFKPIGILTDRDIVVEVLAENIIPAMVTVRDIMTPAPVVIREEDDITTALKIMEKYGVRRLPVTGMDGELTGILTADDLLKVFHDGLGKIISLYNRELTYEKSGRP